MESIDEGEQPLAIARHLTRIIERSLRSVATPQDRADLLRKILAALPDADAMSEALHQREPGTVERLEEIMSASGPATVRLPRPATPLSDTALMTNAQNEPTLAAELRAELVSADHVDLLCAFVKWQGLRLLEDELNELRIRKVQLRVITTTYLGATDARALDEDRVGKLVRDKIPDFIRAFGHTPHVTALTVDAYRIALHDKLEEEINELIAADRTQAVRGGG